MCRDIDEGIGNYARLTVRWSRNPAAENETNYIYQGCPSRCRTDRKVTRHSEIISDGILHALTGYSRPLDKSENSTYPLERSHGTQLGIPQLAEGATISTLARLDYGFTYDTLDIHWSMPTTFCCSGKGSLLGEIE